jgi:hypothetical protein
LYCGPIGIPTKAPATKAPATKAPATKAPTTKAPTTKAPKMKKPTKAPKKRNAYIYIGKKNIYANIY